MQTALGDLRTALQRPLGHSSRPTAVTFAEELERVRGLYPGLEIVLERHAEEVPASLEALAQSILVEAVRNARKHAQATRVRRIALPATRVPSYLRCATTGSSDRRESRRRRRSNARGGGWLGLRLATLEALQCGGVLEYGESEPGAWQVRLVVPTGQ